MLCVRLETLTSSRVFRATPTRKGSVTQEEKPEDESNPIFFFGNPDVLIPTLQNASDAELMKVLYSLSIPIDKAFTALTLTLIVSMNKPVDSGGTSSRRRGGSMDVRTLLQLLSLLSV